MTLAPDTAETGSGWIELYDLAGADEAIRFSPACWAAQLMLAHKGLPVRTRPWRFAEKEAIAFAGSTTVPVIVDHVRGQGRAVHDRWQIALYLDEVYPDRPALLLPGEAGRAHGLMLKHWGERSLVGPLSRLIMLDIYNLLDPGDQPYFRESREARIGMTLEQFHDRSEENLTALSKALNPLRDTLKLVPFLHGSEPGFADYVTYGWLHWGYVVSPQQFLPESDPVETWCERIRSLFGGLAGNCRRLGIPQ
jgi:glutathione S-transferase